MAIELDEAAVEKAARAVWESETHPLLKAAGHSTNWDTLNTGLKREIIRKTRRAIRAYLEAPQP